jgi:hypothetical protein
VAIVIAMSGVLTLLIVLVVLAVIAVLVVSWLRKRRAGGVLISSGRPANRTRGSR